MSLISKIVSKNSGREKTPNGNFGESKPCGPDLRDRTGLAELDLPPAPPGISTCSLRQNLPPAIPCQLCDCPAVWLSTYEDPSDQAAYRCPDCDPPPARSFIAGLWSIAVEPGFHWTDALGLYWEKLEIYDPRRNPWQPEPESPLEHHHPGRHQAAAAAVDGAMGPGGDAGDAGDAERHWRATNDTFVGLIDGDDEELAYDRAHHDPPWRLDPIAIRVGTGLDHPTPCTVVCADGRLLHIFGPPRFDSHLRLVVQAGVEEADRIFRWS